MSENSLLLKSIKNYLKKLKNGQLEIEAGQWELHKDILNMKELVNGLKILKDDVEEMKKNNLEQMGIIQKLQLALSTQAEGISSKKKSNLNDTAIVHKNVDKRLSKNCNKTKDSRNKKTHVVHSEEIIEITSHLESNKSKANATKQRSSQTEKKMETKGLSSPMYSVLHFEKESTESASQNLTSISNKNEDNAMLHRYLKDSAKYCEEKVSNTDVPASQSTGNCNNSNEQYSNDSWKCFKNQSRVSDCRNSDRSSQDYTVSCSDETDKSFVPHSSPCNTENKDLLTYSSYWDKSKRKKNDFMYVCEICKKGFHTKDLSRAHQMVHRKIPVNSTSYHCDYCSNVYKTPQTLEKHVRKCLLIRSLLRKS